MDFVTFCFLLKDLLLDLLLLFFFIFLLLSALSLLYLSLFSTESWLFLGECLLCSTLESFVQDFWLLSSLFEDFLSSFDLKQRSSSSRRHWLQKLDTFFFRFSLIISFFLYKNKISSSIYYLNNLRLLKWSLLFVFLLEIRSKYLLSLNWSLVTHTLILENIRLF